MVQAMLKRADITMDFHPADAFVMSCGTVTLDLDRGKLLLIWNKKLQIHQLPKGRRNIDETMWKAAVRETYEETGIHVRPLRLNIATRATPPVDKQTWFWKAFCAASLAILPKSWLDTISEKTAQAFSQVAAPGNPQVTKGRPSTDYLGACIYPDPQSDAPALKTVFYFAATADSTVAPKLGTQEAHEKLVASWVPVAEAVTKLRFQGEKAVVRKALDDVRNTGYTIGE